MLENISIIQYRSIRKIKSVSTASKIKAFSICITTATENSSKAIFWQFQFSTGTNIINMSIRIKTHLQ